MRLLRRLALVLVVLAVLAAIAVVALRRSLVSGPLRAAAEQRLSAALGQPVTIGELGISILPRLAVTGTGIRIGAADRVAPALRLESVRILPRVATLFGGVVQIDELRLDGFIVSVLRGADGRWHTPAISPNANQGDSTRFSLGEIRIARSEVRVFEEAAGGPRERGRIEDVDADVAITAGGLRLAPLGGRIGGARISGEAAADTGSLDLSFDAPEIADADLDPLLALLGASRPGFLRLQSNAAASGKIRIDRASSRLTGTGALAAPAVALDPLRVGEFEAAFRIDGSTLTFAPTTFAAYGGSHGGTVTLRLDARPRWSADSRIERLDVGAFLDALAGADTRLDGRGRVTAAVGGPIAPSLARSMQGRSSVVVADGVVHDFALIAAINRALRLTAGNERDTRFERLSATLDIGESRALTDDLLLEAGDVRVTAAGAIGFDRTLDLRGEAVVSAARTAAAVASVRELARLTRNGRIEVPLTIAGTLDNPVFRVDVKAAIGTGIKDELLRRLRGIIR